MQKYYSEINDYDDNYDVTADCHDDATLIRNLGTKPKT